VTDLTVSLSPPFGQYEFFRTYFSGSLDSVNQRLQLLDAIGQLEWDSLDQLVGRVVAAGDEEQLQALTSFLEAVNGPIFQASQCD
jgi:hypothetical protein